MGFWIGFWAKFDGKGRKIRHFSPKHCMLNCGSEHLFWEYVRSGFSGRGLKQNNRSLKKRLVLTWARSLEGLNATQLHLLD